MLYIIYRDYSVSNYILERLIKNLDVTLVKVPVLQMSFYMRMIYWIERFFTINISPTSRFSRDNISIFHKIKKDDKILLWDFMQCVDIKYITQIVDSSQNYLWVWNTITKSQRKDIEYYRKNGIKLYTFDPQDAMQYNITLLKQVFRNIPKNNIIECYDFFFIGKDKGRSLFLGRLAQTLIQGGYRIKFLLLADKDTLYSSNGHLEFLSKSISYLTILDLITQSRVIVDITKSDQTGITLRVLEAAFAGKKLLTNNKNVEHLDFYNSKNIMILSDIMPSLKQLENFMQSETSSYDLNILSQYSIDEWIKYFL